MFTPTSDVRGGRVGGSLSGSFFFTALRKDRRATGARISGAGSAVRTPSHRPPPTPSCAAAAPPRRPIGRPAPRRGAGRAPTPPSGGRRSAGAGRRSPHVSMTSMRRVPPMRRRGEPEVAARDPAVQRPRWPPARRRASRAGSNGSLQRAQLLRRPGGRASRAPRGWADSGAAGPASTGLRGRACGAGNGVAGSRRSLDSRHSAWPCVSTPEKGDTRAHGDCPAAVRLCPGRTG